MKIDRSYCSNQNTYVENDPQCIVVHNTDNFAAGANARAHARAQHDGNFQNMSAHYYVDDGDVAYQAAPHSRGCWHVGVNYGGNNLFGRYGNRSSIGVEMCVQKGYNYKKAFQKHGGRGQGDYAGNRYSGQPVYTGTMISVASTARPDH